MLWTPPPNRTTTLSTSSTLEPVWEKEDKEIFEPLNLLESEINAFYTSVTEYKYTKVNPDALPLRQLPLSPYAANATAERWMPYSLKYIGANELISPKRCLPSLRIGIAAQISDVWRAPSTRANSTGMPFSTIASYVPWLCCHGIRSSAVPWIKKVGVL